MKNLFYLLLLSVASLTLNSCEKDENNKPDISFKTGAGYTSSSTTVASGSTVLIGIHAVKASDADVLKKLTVSLSRNGGTTTTEYTADLLPAQQDGFDFDFTPTLGLTAGDKYKFTFTVTDSDGSTDAVDLTLTTN